MRGKRSCMSIYRQGRILVVISPTEILLITLSSVAKASFENSTMQYWMFPLYGALVLGGRGAWCVPHAALVRVFFNPTQAARFAEESVVGRRAGCVVMSAYGLAIYSIGR